MEEIQLPEGIQEVSFKGCSSLRTLNIPKSLCLHVGDFAGCKTLANIYIPDGVRAVQFSDEGVVDPARWRNVFRDSNWKTFSFPEDRGVYRCHIVVEKLLPGALAIESVKNATAKCAIKAIFYPVL